ncbi:L,D-transpeptidase [Streptomyces sp. LE64]|uniref:L,D-transpeptidase n=1 Tax=Streptomyces sp. LE64 TaxID=3448653 RepID=UPI004041CCBC
MASSSAGMVAGLTGAALTAVGFLAYQAYAGVADGAADRAAGRAATTVVSAAPRDPDRPTELPRGAGAGPRVVYALSDHRVWLVGERDRVRRTYRVTPSTVDPTPGAYLVTSRTGHTAGSDGVGVEHVVRFASEEGVSIGFSAAVDGSTAPPDPRKRTGGIRSSRADGNALWEFAVINTPVVVID